MANCAIYEKGKNEIVYFLHDCRQSGRDFRGSNGSVTGVKERLFDVKWTEDKAAPILGKDGQAAGYAQKVSDLSEAKRYRGQVVSGAEDVNAVTRSLIAEKYPPHEEVKILRLKLAGDDTEWAIYHTFVDGLVKEGQEFKKQHFPKE